MLVLTRQKNEDIFIEVGDQRLTLRIIEIRGDKIRLGFDAPISSRSTGAKSTNRSRRKIAPPHG